MNDSPTPETDSVLIEVVVGSFPDGSTMTECVVDSDFARKLERQRDELLVQLESLKAWAKNWDSPFLDDPEFSWDTIDAAIANVKGGQP